MSLYGIEPMGFDAALREALVEDGLIAGD
jgi:hypothetical protein